jgi:hypothetical protein
MGNMASERRSAAAVLVAHLEGMLAALAETAADRDVDWLRPLALLSAEIEYSALRRTDIDAAGLAEECRELRDLLACSPRAAIPFVARYPEARRQWPGVAVMHERALAACDAVRRLAA